MAIVTPAHGAEGRDRMEVTADLGGDSFYEVTFYARMGDGPWQDIGTDDNAPYRAFHDIWDAVPGARVQYKAVVLDNAGHSRRERRAHGADREAGHHARGTQRRPARARRA